VKNKRKASPRQRWLRSKTDTIVAAPLSVGRPVLGSPTLKRGHTLEARSISVGGKESGTRKKFASEQARARLAVDALYPGRDPTQAEVATPQLLKEVNDWLKGRERKPVERNALLRVTGRRKG
jgi:hypothetical protein